MTLISERSVYLDLAMTAWKLWKCHRVVALVLVFLFLVPVSVQARSNGQGAACNDATATLCNYECPESVKAWMVPWAKLKDNGRFGPCCPPNGFSGATNTQQCLSYPPSRCWWLQIENQLSHLSRVKLLKSLLLLTNLG